MNVKDFIIGIIAIVVGILLSPLILGILIFGFLCYAIAMAFFAVICLIIATAEWIESKAKKS